MATAPVPEPKPEPEPEIAPSPSPAPAPAPVSVPDHVYMFNKFLLEVVRHAKTCSTELEAAVRAGFKEVDKNSRKFMDAFLAANDLASLCTLDGAREYEESVLVFGSFTVRRLVAETSMVLSRTRLLADSMLAEAVREIVDRECVMVRQKVLCMCIMAAFDSSFGREDSPAESTTKHVVAALVSAERGVPPTATTAAAGVPEKLLPLLEELAHASMEESTTPVEEEEAEADAAPPSSSSKLGQIARDVAETIQVPFGQETADIGDLLGNPKLLTDVYEKVSEAITKRMASGEITQKELMDECLKLCSPGGTVTGDFSGIMQAAFSAVSGTTAAAANKQQPPSRRGGKHHGGVAGGVRRRKGGRTST